MVNRLREVDLSYQYVDVPYVPIVDIQHVDVSADHAYNYWWGYSPI
jgi:pullulanase/glycogen debranching enzyme